MLDSQRFKWSWKKSEILTLVLMSDAHSDLEPHVLYDLSRSAVSDARCTKAG